MNTIKVVRWSDVPENYTGIIEYENKKFYWFKNGKLHREDGPAVIWNNNSYKEWRLDRSWIWDSSRSKTYFTKYVILSKDPHPLYLTCQVWKYIDGYGIREQIVIPGMEDCIIE